MSFIEIGEIEFTSKKSCFISIPKNWNFRTNNKISIFKIKSLKCLDEREVAMSWSGDTNNGHNCIQINGLFANKLGFSHKQQVLVSHVLSPESNGIPNAIQCYLRPITENDWEILSMNSSFIETNLLNQIRVLVLDQIFPVWITNQSNVCLFVQSFRLLPNNSKAVVLNEFTEIIVCPPNSKEVMNDSINDNNIDSTIDRKPNDRTEETNELKSDSNHSMMSSMFGFVKSFIYQNSNEENESKLKQNSSLESNESSGTSDKIEIKSEFNFNKVLRVLPFFNDNEKSDRDLVNTVFISNDNFNESENKYFVSKLTHILSPNERKRENQKKEKTISDSNELKNISKLISEMEFKETHVLVCAHNRCPDSSVFICDSLRRQMGLSITSRVYLSELSESSITLITELILCPIGVSPKNKITVDLLRTELIRLLEKTSNKTLFLGNGSLIHLCETDFYTLNKTYDSVYAITMPSVKHLLIEMCETVMPTQKAFSETALPVSDVKYLDNKLKSGFNIQFQNKPFAGFEDIFNKCFNFLRLALKLDELSLFLNNNSAVKSCSLLIYGPKGSGKSHLINSLINKLSVFPHFVFVHYIDCRSLKGKRIETIEKNWNNCLAECLHRQPALIVFEDLDAIASLPSKPGQEESAEALYSERVSLLFVDLIEKFNRNDISFGNQLAVIASSKTNKTLQTVLVQTRGKHMFQEIIELSSPDLKQRIDIISKLISNKFGVEDIEKHLNVSLKDIAIKCKGYLPLDISALIDRALHNCFLISKTNNSKDLILTEHNFGAAFDGFSPQNLRGFDLELKSSRRLNEVGGLAHVKKCLMETLFWSIKYPLLFSRLPLKAQSSILLFGAPGTGKTLVIEAIANECGINFIGIKGPELLSKYVGASEQSVRDLFSRAQSARPCILFFDEFDSLAPRRGHDSTGVTDRVVNQLLTQMDGFEALETGVYVLSATSRPDLIDPALLRPGRFDKCLYCPLPNQEERLEILKALSTKLNLSSDVDLEAISRQTNDLSGADLQALLYSAQLDALHNSLNESKQHFNKQQIKASDSTDNQNLEFIASYMPSVEKGFSRDLNCTERQELINEIEIYLPNAIIDGNNSVDILTPKHTSTHTLIAIQQKNLLLALEGTKPSISETERKKYDKIYEAFVSTGGQSFLSSSTLSQKRVTLA